VPDLEKALKFNPHLGTWEILGEAREYAMSQERQDLLLLLEEIGPRTPVQIAKLLGKKSGAVRVMLMRMKQEGLGTLTPNGEYGVTAVTRVTE